MGHENCFLCSNPAQIQDKSDGGVYSVDCQTCGRYRISWEATEDKTPSNPKNYILSGLTRMATSKGTILAIHTDNYDELINSANVPKNPLDMIDRILIYMSENAKTFNEVIKIEPLIYPIAFSKNKEEFVFLCKRAAELGYIRDFKEDRYRLEIEGWKYVQNIPKTNLDSDYVFVAMWFGEETKKLRKSIKNAIKKAGYKAIIADENEYTGNIMDFVLGSIKQSKFIIADFTCIPEEPRKDKDGKETGKVKGGVRGGVYYETGFAKGFGLEVIHLCKNEDKSKNRLHFDVEQENTIFWREEDAIDSMIRTLASRETDFLPKNLSERIYDRIIQVFGKGNVKPA
jgi:hypothetical protein